MTQRLLIKVNGIVQGVGFRPFVFNTARGLGLTGQVSNTATGVRIEIQGSRDQCRTFETALREQTPPLAVIAEITVDAIPVLEENSFNIVQSDAAQAMTTLISPDVATCPDCLNEILDPDNRRYRYPFTNCTNCGPRYTIIENIPYDRPYTSMKHFPMCPECQREYDDPTDRRFHAQPNACPVCGPRLWFTDQAGNDLQVADPIHATASALKDGKVVAIKGLGGFHLAVDACNESAVQTLRKRKGREEKPFALMVRDLDLIREYTLLNSAEESSLTSIQASIVLLKRRENTDLAPGIAPGNDRLGIMLPYTPLHHLLLREGPSMLVMTSANYSEEPICIDNDEAQERLGALADRFLFHNRDIHLRSDDSVVIHLGGDIRPVRRSRGFAPRPIFVNSTGPTVLATGGELKNTVCLLKDRTAFMSQHIGDLENLEAYDFFKMTISHLERIFEAKPKLIVHDLHPRYLSTRWATEQTGIPTLAVQHHHAHLAAVMAEHGLEDPVIGLTLDGTGYGTDGTVWGGEVLVGDYRHFERVGHLEPLLLAGGDHAVREPWRIAVAYLTQAFETNDLPPLPFMKDRDLPAIRTMIERQFNTFTTTSVGRLFDAVAAMSGGCQQIRYEAQAAIEFMQAAGPELGLDDYDRCYALHQGVITWRLKPLFRAIANDIMEGVELAEISRKFHRTLIQVLVEMTERTRSREGIDRVVLSGGVFQNQLLFENLLPELNRSGFEVYTHQQVPTNDGGIALGQAMIGRAELGK